jgi:hypothetical protein
MRIYFLSENNLQDLINHLKNLYSTTIIKFEEKINIYKNDVILTSDVTNITNLRILINELSFTIDQLKDPIFEDFFIKWEIEILEKIRYASVKNHSDKCIARAIFDLLFKYCIDFEYKISYLCCDNSRFKTLQFEILRDLRWKIR